MDAKTKHEIKSALRKLKKYGKTETGKVCLDIAKFVGFVPSPTNTLSAYSEDKAEAERKSNLSLGTPNWQPKYKEMVSIKEILNGKP
jgi:hypothetical protein